MYAKQYHVVGVFCVTINSMHDTIDESLLERKQGIFIKYYVAIISCIILIIIISDN